MITKIISADFDLEYVLQTSWKLLQSTYLMITMLRVSVKFFFHGLHAKAIQKSWASSMPEAKSSLRSSSYVLHL